MAKLPFHRHEETRKRSTTLKFEGNMQFRTMTYCFEIAFTKLSVLNVVIKDLPPSLELLLWSLLDPVLGC